MRPLTLELAGLRSYRQSTRIDFGDISLMAIVGDTGAGKSSLLEAITYGLYGASTWSGQAGDLIADGVQTMRVELIFLADGQRWRATRSMSHSGYPEAVHRLECLDVPSHRFDGRSQVNAEVERLVGLDREGFLRAVILPQGRFADLLVATAAERTRILKNLFRVDELERAREEAGRVLNRCRLPLAALRERRAGLLADPEAAEAAAAAQLEVATGWLAGLTELQQRLAELDQQAQRDATAAAEATRLAEELTDPQLTGATSRLQALTDRAGELARQRQDLAAIQAEAETALAGLRGELAAAEDAGESLDQLSAADSTLETIAEELTAIAEQVQDLEGERAELADETQRLADMAAAADDLAATSGRAGEAAHQRREAAGRADHAVQAARDALATARAAQAALQETEAARTRHEQELTRLKATRAETSETRRAADDDYQAAKAEHELQRRVQAAAHAAHGLGEGDPCPVCERTLPAAFRPPEAPSLAAAQRDLTKAERALGNAQEAATRAATQVETANRRAVELAEQRQAQAAQLATRLAALGAALGQPNPTAAVLERPDDQLLSELATAAHQAAQAATAAEEHAATLREQASAARARLKSDQQAHNRRQGDHDQATGRLRARYHTTARRASRLPSRFRPALPPTGDLLGADRPPLSLDLDQFPPLRGALAERLTEARALDQACQQQAGQHQQASTALARLDAQWRTEIDTPTRTARATLSRLADRAIRAAQHFHADPPPLAPDGDALTPLATWSHQVEALAAGLADQAEQAAAEAAERSARARAAAAELLAGHDLADPEALDGARLEAAGTVRQAEEAAAEACRQAPLAADLDRRISQGGAFLAAVEAVHDLLADGRFIGYVVRQRQQALLGVATEVLADLTGRRYGFAADFQIVDRLTGQPRSTRTLSGGESFLASLALALGMVELAGRAGGRLDAVFLDEGFGGLDTSSLDAAIDALETRAASGRLVAVISHVRLVAERIPNVLGVRATPAGSQVAWLSTTERAEAVDQELAATVEAGLLG
jgi:exonuclease SbcC